MLAAPLALFALTTTSAPASDAPAWHEALLDRIAADVAAGRPLVVQAHVALCDNAVIRCGGHGLGDGNDLRRNLYWATSGGMRGWFDRKDHGWTPVSRTRGPTDDILEIATWKRRSSPTEAWRRRGVTRAFDVYVVAFGWRGSAIDAAVKAYVADLYGATARTIPIEGSTIAAGGAAHLVAYIGHDRWMDYAEGFVPPREARDDERPPVKGTIAMACKTAEWLGDALPSPTRVPLVLTRDFVFAGSHGFEGAVRALARGGDLADVRRGAARSYAEGQGTEAARIDYAFTNPSHSRWGLRR